MCYLYLMTGWRVSRQKKSKMIGPITLFTLLLIQCASSSFVANVTAERTLIFKGSCHKKSRLYTSRIIASVSLHSKLQFIFESLPFYSVFNNFSLFFVTAPLRILVLLEHLVPEVNATSSLIKTWTGMRHRRWCVKNFLCFINNTKCPFSSFVGHFLVTLWKSQTMVKIMLWMSFCERMIAIGLDCMDFKP